MARCLEGFENELCWACFFFVGALKKLEKIVSVFGCHFFSGEIYCKVVLIFVSLVSFVTIEWSSKT